MTGQIFKNNVNLQTENSHRLPTTVTKLKIKSFIFRSNTTRATTIRQTYKRTQLKQQNDISFK